MKNTLIVSELARLLTKKLGKTVPPRLISDLFYKRKLDDNICPIIGGRRIIPKHYVPEIEKTIQEYIK